MRSALQFGPFRVDLNARQLWSGAQPVPLQPKAMDLLVYLAAHPGELVTRDELFERLWPDAHVEDHALSVQIRELRKALGDDVRHPVYIETRHRLGYCFRAPVSRVAAAPEIAPDASPPALPKTHYARSEDVNIAYQIVGAGPVDVVFVMGWVSHLEYFWTEPRFARFLQRMASFSRLILFDKRGTGLSDRVPIGQLPTIEQRMDDVRAVMEAAGSEAAVICGVSEGGCMSAVFAATYPAKTLALIMIGSYARRLRAPDYPWARTVEEREAFIEDIRRNWGGPVGLEERAPSLAADERFREWWSTYLRMGASPGAAVALTRMNTEVDIRHVLPLVGVPALIVHRTGDRCLSVEEGRYLAGAIRGARLVELPGEDHLPFVGDQDSILAHVESFVRDLQDRLAPDHVLATVLVAEFEPAETSRISTETVKAELREKLLCFRATAAEVTGQAVVAAFDGPARAVRCAGALKQRAEDLTYVIKLGLHTGECICSGSSIGGTAVDVARRLTGSAPSGHVRISGTVRDLIAGSGIILAAAGRLEAGQLGEWQILDVQQCRLPG